MNRLGAAAIVAAAAAAVALPFFLKPFGIYLISMWVVLTIAAIGLNLTLGYAGQVSLAQGAFVGIGAYSVALLTQSGWPYPLAFVFAGLLLVSSGSAGASGYPKRLKQIFPSEEEYDRPVHLMRAYDLKFLPYKDKGIKLPDLLRRNKKHLANLMLALDRTEPLTLMLLTRLQLSAQDGELVFTRTRSKMRMSNWAN